MGIPIWLLCSWVTQMLIEHWGKLCVLSAGSGTDCSHCCLYGDDLRAIGDDKRPSQHNSADYDVMISFYEARQ